MLHSSLLISPCAAFWEEVARAISTGEALGIRNHGELHDFSEIRVIVPTFVHAQQLRAALATRRTGAFIPPRITTLSAWLALQPPSVIVASDSERLMRLYSELRQHGWLKKLFTARRNTELLPLARTLLTLCDELTQALLPAIRLAPDAADERWQAALDGLAPVARNILSDEAQLVWSIWKTQLDESDPCVARFTQMMRLAERAEAPLVWVSPVEPDAFETAFLNAYGERQTVLPIMLDWGEASIDSVYAAAWPSVLESAAARTATNGGRAIAPPAGLSLCAAKNLEDEALRGAQTIIDWINAGKSKIAIIAQDRVVARRMRALLERAQVFVSDETGWKLSTTRAAAALAAWFDVVAACAETMALLDLLKSPFLFADVEKKPAYVMAIELALRSANVSGGWDAAAAALRDLPSAHELLSRLAQQAELFAGGRRTLPQWIEITYSALDAMGMRAALQEDAAGAQMIELLAAIAQDCRALEQAFSFAEWRAFINLQLECTPFIACVSDDRVVMLPLNGAHLRTFDAVLMVGADADHLPSQPHETLFFANAVCRELGLATRESRQRQQLRDLTELLHSSRETVLSWQAYKAGEPNPVSPWIARLQLVLARAAAADIPAHVVRIQPRSLMPLPVKMPRPSAPQLMPAKLSASGYNSFVACPYQFFAMRMLGLSGLDELSDMPEKRDYGDWLHQILKIYHETVRDQKIPCDDRLAVLREISERIFAAELAKNAAALSYYVRWQKAVPAYLTWANERETQGWRFAVGERWFEKTLQWPDGAITLHGRIDRIDENDAGELAVLDYKTRTQQALSSKFKQIEDHQLAFYGILSETPAACAHYVALEPVREKTGDAEAPNYTEWQNALADHIVRNMRAISQGAALPASGIESVCQYCEVRGMCRKGAW
jgi:ATP-dependent helicase/nuclease subunit B